MFKKNKPAVKMAAPPVEAVTSVEEEAERKVIEEQEEQVVSTPVKPVQEANSEEELTEDKVKEIFSDHELRLRKIEYHLRLS